MSPGLFILSIISYLITMVASLLGSFFSKYIPNKLILAFIILHLSFMVLWLFMRDESDSVVNPGISNYLFLAYFCSGILVAGVFLRKKYPVYLKLYFTIFLLSLAVFIVSPSRVLGFISSGKINAISSQRFHIQENYYFVEQQSVKVVNRDSTIAFKLIREMGFFHKTLSRDVLLPASTDSVAVIDFKENENIFVRIYYKKKSSADSLDLSVPLVLKRDSSAVITKKKST